MIKISPSVLACDFSHIADEVGRVEAAGAEYLHLDVMDGIFVPNISFGPELISAARRHSKAVFDVHLMICDPSRYIKEFIKAGADIITIHYESCADHAGTLRLIKDSGIKAGITVKPKTPVSVLGPLLGLCDMILIMTVEPGFGGQKLIPETIDKIREAASMINNGPKPQTELEVDGGITPENVNLAVSAGANVIVAGSAIFKAPDAAEAIRRLRIL